MTSQPRPTIRQQALIVEKLFNYDERPQYAEAFDSATTYDELVAALVDAAGIPIPAARACLVWAAQRTHLTQQDFDDKLSDYLLEFRRNQPEAEAE